MPHLQLILLAFYSLVLTAGSSFSQIGNSLVGSGSFVGFDSVALLTNVGAGNLVNKQFCINNCQVTLPVTGFELAAKRTNKATVMLQWVTRTEINNKGIFIERSFGQTSTFASVGFVDGARNSTLKKTYKRNDENAYSGITYYRLRQEDLDGHFTYSNIVEVKGMEENTFTIWPNPAKQSFTIHFLQPIRGNNITIAVMDAAGGLVLQRVTGGNGVNNITIAQPNLPPGTYVIRIVNGKNTWLGKVVIVR